MRSNQFRVYTLICFLSEFDFKKTTSPVRQVQYLYPPLTSSTAVADLEGVNRWKF